MPKISVIVPVYRVEKYIDRCVDSILGQTFPDFELILVDDGSPDNCGAICDEYACKDSRVVVLHQKNGGLSAARNAGIDWMFANSDSQWLTFIDSDDWVHPVYLERLLNAAVKNAAQVSVCAYSNVTEEKVLPVSMEIPRLWIPEDFYLQHRVNATIACAKLYKKDCFRNIRFPVGKIHEDEFTTYKILFSLDKVAVDPTSLYYYYVNSEGIMKSAWTCAKLDRFDAFENQIVFFRDNGYENAYRFMAREMIFDAFYMLGRIREAAPEDIKSQKNVRDRLRRYLLRYGSLAKIRIAKYCGIYEEAFPRFMKLYWYSLAALRKLGIRK